MCIYNYAYMHICTCKSKITSLPILIKRIHGIIGNLPCRIEHMSNGFENMYGNTICVEL